MITGGDLRQSRLDIGYKTFTISPWLSPNAAFLDGKSFEYKNGETNGETTKMTFFGPSGEVLKFLVNPVNNLYRMGLTSGATFEEINCTEI